MTTPSESHIKAAIIGMHKSGAKPGEIAHALNIDFGYVKEVIAKYKPKK